MVTPANVQSDKPTQNTAVITAQGDRIMPNEEEILCEHICIFLRNHAWCRGDSIVESVGLPAPMINNQLESLVDQGLLKTITKDTELRYALR